MRKTSILLATFAFAFVLSVSTANAVSTNSSQSATNTQTNATQKLNAVKLKVCQNKESAIQKRNTQLTKMADNMLTKFDGIARKVETYYTSKAIPNGKTISNYDALVSEIGTKKAAVQTNLDKANTDATAFDCNGDSPKTQLTQFRTDMQAVKQSLKDYRTSIKNLIVAIRSVSKTTNSNLNSNINTNSN